MRAVQAERNFLELAGRTQEAEKLNDLLDRLEAQYADNEEIDEDDVFVDNDLEVIDEDMLAGLGIDPRAMADYLDSVQPDEPEESEPEETAEKEATDETENEE